MGTHLAARIAQWQHSPGPGSASCDLHSSSIRIIKAPIPVALKRELDALASVLGEDASCLAGELLADAIQDALARLPGPLAGQVAASKAEQARAREMAEEEMVRFDPGRT